MLTRAAIERVLVARLGAMLGAAGLEQSVVGNNDALADPLAWGLRQLGYQPAALDTVVDADLIAVAAAHVDALLDLAELRTLESILTNYTQVDSKVGQVSESAGQLLDQLRNIAPAKRAAVQAAHGRYLIAPLTEETSRSVRLWAV